MAKKMNLGAISFLGLTGLAILSGIGMPASLAGVSIAAMGVLGIIAGMVNISTKEVMPFLTSITALVVGGVGIGIAGAFDVITLGPMVTSIITNLASAYTAMAVVVALRTIIKLGKN